MNALLFSATQQEWLLPTVFKSALQLFVHLIIYKRLNWRLYRSTVQVKVCPGEVVKMAHSKSCDTTSFYATCHVNFACAPQSRARSAALHLFVTVVSTLDWKMSTSHVLTPLILKQLAGPPGPVFLLFVSFLSPSYQSCLCFFGKGDLRGTWARPECPQSFFYESERGFYKPPKHNHTQHSQTL